MTAVAPPHPAPAAAPLARRVLAQARLETAVLLRNGEQLLVSVVLPVLALVGLTRASAPDLGAGPRVDVVVPGVLALAVLSSAFTGQAIQTGFDRRYGVLRLLGTTPLGRGGLLAGKALAVLAVLAVQVVVLGAVGLALGWRPDVGGLAPALLVGLAGTAAFVALALLVAGTLRAEAVLAVANLLWVLLLAGGAVVLPARTLPSGLETLAAWLPSGALGEGLRHALGDGRLDVRALLVLLGWTALAGLLARRTFRWQ
ncbi:ABC transporter permease [Angustibacter peucedani]